MNNDKSAEMYSKRYLLHESLGEGGMGEVFRAVDRLRAEEIAIKLVSEKGSERLTMPSDSVDSRTSLTREFELLASIRHPNVISVLDYGFDKEKHPYFTMELLKQPHYITEVAEGKSPKEKVNLLVQMLQALSYLYRRDILHRDLKPANVLAVGDNIKILDFGLATRVDQKQLEDDGDVFGTLAYISPEALLGENPTVASDLYAVGVIAYQMFAGKHPFDTSNLNTLISQIVSEVPDTKDIDTSEGLQATLDRLLSKDPQDRYRTAEEVINALCDGVGIPAPSETLAVRDSFLQSAKFVGREKELAQLVSALEDAENRQGSLWLVGGESGVGKTRLMDELRIQALVRGITLTRGQTADQGGLIYQVWREVLRWMSLLTDINPFEASIIKSILPDIDALVEFPVPPAPQIDPRGLNERLMGIIQGIFARLQQPLVILLDDLQWAGDESISLLQRLTPQLAQLPILVIGTYRNDERPKLPEELPNSHVLNLKRLSSKAVAALSKSMIGEVGDQHAVVEMLERETEGNVFFIVEVMRVLAEEAGGLDQIGSATLPTEIFAAGIQNIIQRRLERIPESLQNFVNLAAVAGRVIDEAVITAALPDVDVPKALTVAADAAVMDVANNQWRFTHDKIRESILQQLDDASTSALHGQIAEAIEQVYADTVDQAAKLAFHYGQAGNDEKERIYAHQAGELELQNGAYSQATLHLKRAYELTEKLPDSPDKIQQELNIQLNIATLNLITRGQSASDTKAAYDKAYELVNQLHQSPQLFQVLFGMWAYYLFSGAFDEAWEVAQQCLALAEQFNISGMIIESKVAVGNTAFWMGDYELARECLQAVDDLYDPAEHDKHLVQFGQDPRITARVFGSWASFILGYSEQALQLSFDALEIGKARNHPYSIVMSLQIITWNYYHIHDVESVMRYGGELMELSEKEGFPVFLAIGMMLQGWGNLYATSPQAGIGQIEAAVDLWRSLGGSLPTFPMLILSEAYLQAGDYETALEKVQTGLSAARTSKELAYESELLRMQGDILAKLGQIDQAKSILSESLGIAQKRQAKSLELRSLMSLYRLSPNDDLKTQIKIALESLSEGQDTADLLAAQAIVAAS